MKSLRLKTIIMIVLIVLISSGLISWISYHRAKEMMSSQLEDSYSIAADNYANELTAWLNTRATILETLAVEFEVDEVYQKDYDSLQEYLAEGFGRVNEEGYIYDIYFTYPDNVMVCASGFVPDGEVDFVNQRDWYIQAVKTGELYYSNPYKDLDSGRSTITISKAVYKDGELQGVLALDVFVNTLIDIVNQARLAKNSYAFLVDQDLEMILHPNEAYKYDDSPIGVLDVEGCPYQEVIDNIRQKSDAVTYVKDYDGVTRGIIVSKMENTGWYVGIATDKNELMKNINAQMQEFLVAALSAVVIGIIISMFLAIALNTINTQDKERENLQKMKEINMNIIRSLVSTIDAKDQYTSGHSQRVAEYATEIAKRMGKTEEEQQIVYYAGVLHDIGKIRVAEDVIDKPGELSDQEFDEMRVHPISGYYILHNIKEDDRVGNAAKYHHERFDGKGYPNGLIGDAIPEIARIIAVADAYDAMTSERSYRKVLPQDVVRDEIEKGKGTQFDPDIADIMIDIIDEDTTYRLRQTKEKTRTILAVDDDRISLTILRGIVKEVENVNFIGVTTSKEAFETLKKMDISLLIIDLKMPDTDGFTLYKKICEKKKIPAILMTGTKDEELIDTIRDIGFEDYLTKPLNVGMTKEAIHGILRRYQSLYSEDGKGKKE